MSILGITIFAPIVLVVIFLLAWLFGQKNGFAVRLATIFLSLVGIEYIFMGFLAVIGLSILAGVFGALYVAPEEIIDIGRAGQDWFKVNRSIELTLGLLSIFGGILGIFGAIQITHNKKIGYKIWMGLTLISIIVVLWNFIYSFQGERMFFPFYFFWPLIYSLALYIVWKNSYKDAI